MLKTGKNITKAVFLGHQKSGTTAIANLVAKRAGLSYSNDPVYNCARKSVKNLKMLENDDLSIIDVVNNNKGLFYRDVVKDPDFSLSPSIVKEIYPSAKIVFISRKPEDIIRSIFDRLGLDGRNGETSVDGELLHKPTPHWEYMLNGDGIDGRTCVERLASRIERVTIKYLEIKDECILINYEDFRKDKLDFIDRIIQKLGLQPLNNIDRYLDYQFQPKGISSQPEEFFSTTNQKIIDNCCKITKSQFGY